MKLKELQERRIEIVKEIRRLADLANNKDHEWTTENEENWTRANTDFNDLEAQIQKEQRAIELETTLDAQPDPRRPIIMDRSDETHESAVATEADKTLALQGWMRCQANLELEERHEAACRRAGVNPHSTEYVIQLRSDYDRLRHESRMTTTATEGGEYIPVGFVNQLEIALLGMSPMRQVSTILRTSSGNALHMPTTNDTGNVAVLLAEAGEVLALDVVTSELVLNAYKYTSKSVKVSSELLQDSAFDLAGVLARILGERLGRGTDAAYTTGTGSSQPNGIVTASTMGKTTAGATAITSDEVIDLVHSVDVAYRQGAAFMMKDSTYAYLRKIKSAVDGRYMWEPNYQVSGPDRLLGYPVWINNSMAAIASTAKTVLFGLLSKYIIRDVGAIRMRRLVERYADYDQEAFVAFLRTDGDLLDAGTHPVKHMLQAT